MKLVQTRRAVARAPRFAVGAFIRFRGRREREWHEGEVENISRSGVLLRSGHSLAAETPVRMGLLLETADGARAEVECRGVVARVTPLSAAGREVRLAVTIDNYRFVRTDCLV